MADSQPNCADRDNQLPPGKCCRTCGQVKPLTEFCLHSVKTGILRAHCRECITASRQGYKRPKTESLEKCLARPGAIDRFWASVNKTDGCWEWTGSLYRNGYGRLWIGPYRVLAHRLSFIIANGEIPGRLLVCHRCDNRVCVRPDHLFLGTHKENMEDCVRKGRINTLPHDNPLRGEQHPLSRLTDDDVRDIRSRYEGGVFQRDLAKEYGVTQVMISRIVLRKAWKHVP